MKKFLALAIMGLALASFGCAGTQAKNDDMVSKDTMVKCPKCGAEFRIRELWEKP